MRTRTKSRRVRKRRRRRWTNAPNNFSPSNMPHLQSFFFENQFLWQKQAVGGDDLSGEGQTVLGRCHDPTGVGRQQAEIRIRFSRLGTGPIEVDQSSPRCSFGKTKANSYRLDLADSRTGTDHDVSGPSVVVTDFVAGQVDDPEHGLSQGEIAEG